MLITLNGEAREAASGKSLLDLVKELGLDPKAVVAERNGNIVERASFAELVLAEGDTLELIRLVGGG